MHLLFLSLFWSCSTSQKTIDEANQETKNIQEKSKEMDIEGKKSTAKIKHVAVPELFQIYSAGKIPVIIDVRSDQEYKKVHIPTAIHIPLQDIVNRSQEIEGILKGKDSEFYLVSAVGGRSNQAAEQLSEMGFAKPINVMGGTNGWVAMGFPTEKRNKK